jgi:hypothetical protein
MRFLAFAVCLWSLLYVPSGALELTVFSDDTETGEEDGCEETEHSMALVRASAHRIWKRKVLLLQEWKLRDLSLDSTIAHTLRRAWGTFSPIDWREQVLHSTMREDYFINPLEEAEELMYAMYDEDIDVEDDEVEEFFELIEEEALVQGVTEEEEDEKEREEGVPTQAREAISEIKVTHTLLQSLGYISSSKSSSFMRIPGVMFVMMSCLMLMLLNFIRHKVTPVFKKWKREQRNKLSKCIEEKALVMMHGKDFRGASTVLHKGVEELTNHEEIDAYDFAALMYLLAKACMVVANWSAAESCLYRVDEIYSYAGDDIGAALVYEDLSVVFEAQHRNEEAQEMMWRAEEARDIREALYDDEFTDDDQSVCSYLSGHSGSNRSLSYELTSAPALDTSTSPTPKEEKEERGRSAELIQQQQTPEREEEEEEEEDEEEKMLSMVLVEQSPVRVMEPLTAPPPAPQAMLDPEVVGNNEKEEEADRYLSATKKRANLVAAPARTSRVVVRAADKENAGPLVMNKKGDDMKQHQLLQQGRGMKKSMGLSPRSPNVIR